MKRIFLVFYPIFGYKLAIIFSRSYGYDKKFYQISISKIGKNPKKPFRKSKYLTH